ncbi:hypothetical protein HDU79_010739 [Rhizoclosmatium sp. JEL0117]|nr:hypothetical protein HDU79_010739 [Rhizoclosmatium sp. JEL0117]
MQVFTTLLLALATVSSAAPNFNNRRASHGTCPNGVFTCGNNGHSLFQCGYVEGNMLDFRFHSDCPQGTLCEDSGPNGFVGCKEANRPRDAELQINRRYAGSSSCSNGAFSCGYGGHSLFQCGFVEGNMLDWRFHSKCPHGTRCEDDGPNGFVGCKQYRRSRDGKEDDEEHDYHHHDGHVHTVTAGATKGKTVKRNFAVFDYQTCNRDNDACASSGFVCCISKSIGDWIQAKATCRPSNDCSFW